MVIVLLRFVTSRHRFNFVNRSSSRSESSSTFNHIEMKNIKNMLNQRVVVQRIMNVMKEKIPRI